MPEAMAHRSKSHALRCRIRAAARAATPEPQEVVDRRGLADFFAAWRADRCGRPACFRAGACVAPGAPCVIEHRERIRDRLIEIADSDLLADPDDLDDEAEAEEPW